MGNQTTDFSLVYFGDSLTDDGNLYDITAETLLTPYPPDAYGYDHKFTDGQVWSQIEAEFLNAGSYANYAYGGAEAVGTQTLDDYLALKNLTDITDDSLLGFDINLGAQVDRFLADMGGTDLSGTTASIMIGANDYLNFVPSSTDPVVVLGEAQALVGNVINATMDAVTTLLEAGVGEVVVNTLPPADFFPFFETASYAEKLLSTQVFASHDFYLIQAVEGLAATGADVQIVDLAPVAEEIMADPTTFGFIAPLGDSVVFDMGGDTSAAGYDPDQVAFFDEVHPTEAGHGVLGVFHAENLTSDVTLGGLGNDQIATGSNDDLVLASGGDDIVTLGKGDDVGLGGLGNDVVEGGRGDDILSGGSGKDELSGGTGDDVLAGGRGDDVLYGGIGNDVLIDGLGSDTLFGGNGDDIFLYAEPVLIGGAAPSTDIDNFDGGNGDDTLYLAISAETKADMQACLDSGESITDVLASAGICATNIENVEFLDSRMDLASIETDAPLHEADLWGFV